MGLNKGRIAARLAGRSAVARIGGSLLLRQASRFVAASLTTEVAGGRPGPTFQTDTIRRDQKLPKFVKDQGFLIDGNYGTIKGTTFCLSNMGDETDAIMKQLYAALDSGLKQL